MLVLLVTHSGPLWNASAQEDLVVVTLSCSEACERVWTVALIEEFCPCVNASLTLQLWYGNVVFSGVDGLLTDHAWRDDAAARWAAEQGATGVGDWCRNSSAGWAGCPVWTLGSLHSPVWFRESMRFALSEAFRCRLGEDAALPFEQGPKYYPASWLTEETSQDCWGFGFTADYCCSSNRSDCWDALHSYDRCCHRPSGPCILLEPHGLVSPVSVDMDPLAVGELHSLAEQLFGSSCAFQVSDVSKPGAGEVQVVRYRLRKSPSSVVVWFDNEDGLDTSFQMPNAEHPTIPGHPFVGHGTGVDVRTRPTLNQFFANRTVLYLGVTEPQPGASWSLPFPVASSSLAAEAASPMELVSRRSWGSRAGLLVFVASNCLPHRQVLRLRTAD
mmetsp:Transcript_44900/g.118576  ORF Transcript_44900/g.118576 Transcript_44900/m.118576 type:complete len:387 (+) Transcript_44900:3-1163(+)